MGSVREVEVALELDSLKRGDLALLSCFGCARYRAKECRLRLKNQSETRWYRGLFVVLVWFMAGIFLFLGKAHEFRNNGLL